MVFDECILDRVFQPIVNATMDNPLNISSNVAIGGAVLSVPGFVMNVIGMQMISPMHVLALANIGMLAFATGLFSFTSPSLRQQMRPGRRNPLRYAYRWFRPITAGILLTLGLLNMTYFGIALIDASFTLAACLLIGAGYFQSCDFPPVRPRFVKRVQIVS